MTGEERADLERSIETWWWLTNGRPTQVDVLAFCEWVWNAAQHRMPDPVGEPAVKEKG